MSKYRVDRVKQRVGGSAMSFCEYESYSVCLSDAECESMYGLSAGAKAEKVVRKHLAREHGEQVRIEADQDGADLKIFLDGKIIRIQVVGSPTTTIAWNLMKVLGQKSHDALKSGKVALFYVVDVDSQSPRIYVLKHGRDFYLEQEPKWSVAPVKPEDEDKYPLRGSFYRYDDPFEPVAVEDWEFVKW